MFLVTNYGVNALVYGILASTYPAFQLIRTPVLGRWSDLYGRKKILLLSQVGTLLAWIIFCVQALKEVRLTLFICPKLTKKAGESMATKKAKMQC